MVDANKLIDLLLDFDKHLSHIWRFGPDAGLQSLRSEFNSKDDPEAWENMHAIWNDGPAAIEELFTAMIAAGFDPPQHWLTSEFYGKLHSGWNKRRDGTLHYWFDAAGEHVRTIPAVRREIKAAILRIKASKAKALSSTNESRSRGGKRTAKILKAKAAARQSRVKQDYRRMSKEKNRDEGKIIIALAEEYECDPVTIKKDLKALKLI